MQHATTLVPVVLALTWCVPASADPSQQAVSIIRQLGGRVYAGATARRPLSGYEALRRIQRSKPVYVDLSIGRLRRGQWPPRGEVFTHPNPSVLDHKRSLEREFLKPLRVRVDSTARLLKLNATDQLTAVDTRSSLSRAEASMVGLLRPFDGGVEGSARIKWVGMFRPHDYVVKVSSLKPGDRSGLYTPGPLGQRLSVLEAAERLKRSQPVNVVRHGRATPLGSQADLELFIRSF
jgi:hypothetical protein